VLRNSWTGCGSEGWCDVEPGCSHAQEAVTGGEDEGEYHGWDACTSWDGAAGSE
jgi:hypothetical protein